MSKPWSKLQSRLYNLMDRTDNFQIHCVAYRMPGSRSHNPQIPRYWITVGKGENQKIIWDYPRDFDFETYKNSFDKGHWDQNYLYFGQHVSNISDLIAEYINTPKLELVNKKFDNDHYGLVEILKQYDRRTGLKKHESN